MIYLKLFLQFLKIGTFSFGGGYGMISIIRETVLSEGWLDETELMDMIGISETTPGPLAVNMATFIGSRAAGFPGALIATFGVVLPAFMIILLIASVMGKLMKKTAVSAFMSGVRPCVIALILGTALVLGLNVFLNVESICDAPAVSLRAIVLFIILIAVKLIYKKQRDKNISPIVLIILSAIAGIIIF